MKLNIWPWRKKTQPATEQPKVTVAAEATPPVSKPTHPDSVTQPVEHLKRVLREKEQELEQTIKENQRLKQQVHSLESHAENLLNNMRRVK